MKAKKKNSLPWSHYEFISGLNLHQIYDKKLDTPTPWISTSDHISIYI